MIAVRVDLRARRDRIGEDGGHALERGAKRSGGVARGEGRRADSLHGGDEPRQFRFQVADQRGQLAAHQPENDEDASRVRNRGSRDIAQRAQGTERGEQRERERAPPLLVD